MAKDDEERIQEYINEQIVKAKLQTKLDQEFIATELQKDDDESVKLDLKLKEIKQFKCDTSTILPFFL